MSGNALTINCPNCHNRMSIPASKLPDKPMGLVKCTACGTAIKFKIPDAVRSASAKTEIGFTESTPKTAFEGYLLSESGTTFSLEIGKNIVGRTGSIALGQEDKKVSRKHCLIEVKKGAESWEVLLSDDGTATEKPSTNGTFFEESRLSIYDKVYLKSGDKFRVGRTLLTYHEK